MTQSSSSQPLFLQDFSKDENSFSFALSSNNFFFLNVDAVMKYFAPGRYKCGGVWLYVLYVSIILIYADTVGLLQSLRQHGCLAPYKKLDSILQQPRRPHILPCPAHNLPLLALFFEYHLKSVACGRFRDYIADALYFLASDKNDICPYNGSIFLYLCIYAPYKYRNRLCPDEVIQENPSYAIIIISLLVFI